MSSESLGLLETPIAYLKGVGPVKSAVLNKYLQIFTFNDLLNYFPFRYIDKSKIHKINEIVSDQVYIQLKGTISDLKEVGSGRGKRLTAIFRDDTGSIELVWFQGIKWVLQSVREGYEYYLFGKPNVFKHTFSIAHPELELSHLRDEKKVNIQFQPVYSTTEGLSRKGLDSKGILKLQITLLERILNDIDEILPGHIVSSFHLLNRKEAFRHIHFPSDSEKLEKARYRLIFEELFIQQLEILSFRVNREKNIKGIVFGEIGQFFKTFYNGYLPFELTDAQKRVIREIRNDMRFGKQMNRLLQGDVGSGKTIVALMSMLIAKDNGFQCALMAPTEILAVQHFNTITSLLSALPLKIALLTGSTRKADRKKIFAEVETGETDILIGTHALIEDNIRFCKLGLAVIDEQHKFGVAQRAKLWKKNVNLFGTFYFWCY